MKFYAHTAEHPDGTRDPDQSKWQPLADHLRNVAELAATFAAPMGPEAAAEARLAGLLHDLGKYQPSFQHYLAYGRPRTPHAIHGGALLDAKGFRTLANVIASHHAGLHDDTDDLVSAINQARPLLRELLTAFTADGLKPTPPPSPRPDRQAADTHGDLHLRLLLSALADADYLDTEKHFLRAKGLTRLAAVSADISELLRRLDDTLRAFAAKPGRNSLDEIRSLIAKRCAEAGRTSAPGAFSLTVPTGGGKTLASAAFALHHAVIHGFKRVIYVIPYTSIIEQNARVFAAIFGSENVLEHHSLADWRNGDDNDPMPDSAAARARLAAENWDAPFIVATNVQFFESLHSHRPSALRKIHRLLDTVVLFDECQTFPPELIDPTLETLQALQAYGRTSLVFCTATQPALQQREFFPAGFPTIEEIIPAKCPDWHLHARPEFRRTRIRYSSTPLSIPDFAARVADRPRALAIVNTRRHARELYDAIRTRAHDSTAVYHLSTFMCPAHRLAVLDAIRQRLADPAAPCLVVSTQLIEAGVDLDFPCVFRVLGPLDAILQAAGRCNREGRLRDPSGHPISGDVEVVTLADARLPVGVYQRATTLSTRFLALDEWGEITPDAIDAYFRALYHDTNRDKHDIAYLRSQRLHRKVGQTYRWIEEDEPTESVLTDYDSTACAWIATLEAQGHQPLSGQQHRQIARLSINLRASEIRCGERAGILRRLPCGLLVTQKSYDPTLGYNPKAALTGDQMIF